MRALIPPARCCGYVRLFFRAWKAGTAYFTSVKFGYTCWLERFFEGGCLEAAVPLENTWDGCCAIEPFDEAKPVAVGGGVSSFA